MTDSIISIEDLVSKVRLSDVRLIERTARLSREGDKPAHASENETSPAVDIDIHPVSWGAALETWFRMRVQGREFEASAAFSVVFDLDEPLQIPVAVRKEFIERVSIMVAFPYLRAEIQRQVADLRCGDLVLGLLRPGDFSVSLPEDSMDALA